MELLMPLIFEVTVPADTPDGIRSERGNTHCDR